jgi:glycosyltransferase involved in cell wall biosynthesis
MKILQVTNKVPFPTKDGGAIACMNLTRGFSNLGHQVTIISMNTEKHHISIEEIPEPVKDLAKFNLVEVPARISKPRALINLLFSRKPYNAARFISRTFKNELKILLQKNSFDIVQLEGLYLCPYVPVIRKYSSAKIVYRAHNIEHEIWERTAVNANGILKFYLKNLSRRIKRFETRCLNTYDLIVPITERDHDLLDKMGNTKPGQVSQTGIDASVLIPNAKSLEHPSLFHIGSLEWTPNQEGINWFMDNCWPQIHKTYPDLKFYIAGRNAPAWLIHKLDVKNVQFEGEVEDAYQFMNSKSIMIAPLLSGSGMRIKIIEGMALGKPIVTTTIGTEGISTESGKNIVLADEPDQFVNAVSDLINNKEYFHLISKNAIEYIHEKFDNLASSSALIEFYKKHIE